LGLEPFIADQGAVVMTRLLLAAAFASAIAVPAAFAADPEPGAVPATPAAAAAPAAPEKKLSPQNQKMKDCNKKAKEQSLKGSDRKKFMSGCLKKNGSA
jgi:hypothetical protein